VNHDASVSAGAGIGVAFRPQILTGTAQFRPWVEWHADWDLMSFGATAHASGGFSLWAESWDLQMSSGSHEVYPDQKFGPVWTDGSSLFGHETHSDDCRFRSVDGIYALPITSRRIYRFWIENDAHVDASAGDYFGSQANATFAASIPFMVIQEYP
jgi:hypothetical protein